MIYFVSFLVCIYLAWMYDILGYTKNKRNWYYLLLIWFICVSGFQYMVGSDMQEYVLSYENSYKKIDFMVDEIGGRYQPGWMLLSYFCHQISNDFVFFKFIQAIFVNVAVFSFFKRESKYVFLCISIYALTSYLLLNFNILRQSFAIGFILYYISSIKRKKYVQAFVYLIFAFMFHNSALLALIVPFWGLIKYNKKVFWFTIMIVIIGSLFLLRVNADTILKELVDSGIMGDNLTELGNVYVNSDHYGAHDIRVGVVYAVRVTLVLLSVLFYIKKKQDFFFGGMGIVYLFFLIFSFSFPIALRFRVYFDMAFYVMLSVFIVEVPYGRFWQIRRVFAVVVFIIYSYFPCKEYASKYESTHYRYFDQYYPYVSIFNPEDADLKKNFY